MRPQRYILTWFAAALVAMQALWSGLAATAYAAGVDEARFLCAQLTLPAEARAQIAELAALAGEDPVHDTPVEPVDCAACALGQAPALAAQLVLAERTALATGLSEPMVVGALTARQPTGPPVGLRAPPVSF